MARAGLVAACRNRPELPGFRKEIPDPVTPFAHLPVAVPRHQTGPPRWHHRHGTSRRPAFPPPRQARRRPAPRPQSEPRTRDPRADPACRRDRGPAPEEEQTAQDGQARPRPPLSCPSNPRRSGQCPVSRSPLRRTPSGAPGQSRRPQKCARSRGYPTTHRKHVEKRPSSQGAETAGRRRSTSRYESVFSFKHRLTSI